LPIIERTPSVSDFFHVERHVEEWCDGNLDSVDQTIA
jgi:hypothetical protein